MKTLKDNPLMMRIGVGKLVGFIIGLIGVFTLGATFPEGGLKLQLGLLFWYATMGAIIGVYGVVTWHPVLHLPLPWWLRAPLIGSWMNFLLALLMYEKLQAIIFAVLGPDTGFASPFWFVFEGAIAGLIIGFFCTRMAGEGEELISDQH